MDPLPDRISGSQRPKSCVACRQSKRRCDRATPCATCLRYGHRCYYQGVMAAVSPSPASRYVTEAYPSRHGTSVRPPGPVVSSPGPVAEPRSTRRAHSNGYIVPAKGRFIEGHSSAASPRSLGLALGMDEPPRLHAFAYHLGIRREPGTCVHPCIVELVLWEQTRSLIDLYVSVIHPVFGFVSPDALYRRSQLHWHGQAQGLPFEAFVGGVIALASLFSALLPEETESKIVHHAKAVLEDLVESRSPCLDIASAWILRTLYLRATGRPYAANLASIVSMNLVEVMGLHKDSSMATLAAASPSADCVESPETRERVALTARNLHVLLAYDYGRSIMNLGPLPRDHVQATPGDFILQISALADAVSHSLGSDDPDDSRVRLDHLLEDLIAAPSDHDFVLLAKAELCFAVYRRLRLLSPGPEDVQVSTILDAGMAAVPAARRLAAQKHPWWNVIHVLFQQVCVLLSVDSPQSLANLAPTVEALEMVTRQFHSWLAGEALAVARLLLHAAANKKNGEASLLNGISNQAFANTGGTSLAVTDAELDAFLQQMPLEWL